MLFNIFAGFSVFQASAQWALIAAAVCGPKEAFCVSHQLSWQPVKSFECRRRLHAVQNKQEERDAGSPKAKVVSGFDEWDMKSDTAQPMTGKRNAMTPQLKRNTK